MVDDEEQPPAPQPLPKAPDELNDITGLDEQRLFAALSYLTVLVFVPLLTRKNDPFVNFHVRQGLVILAGFIIAALAAVWINWIGSLLFIVLLVADVIALVLTLQGRSWKIPGLSILADAFRI